MLSTLLLSEDAHHPAFSIEFDYGCSLKTSDLPVQLKGYNFKKANFSDLYSELAGSAWNFLHEFDDPNSALSAFYNRLYEILDRHVPARGKSSGTYPVWYNGKIIRLLKVKGRAWNKYKRVPTTGNYETFKSLRSRVKFLIDEAHKKYSIHVEREIRANPRAFWAHMDSRKRDSGLPSVMLYNDTELHTSKAMVDAFADTFMKNFNICNNSLPPQTPVDNKTSSFLSLTSVSESEVLSSLKRIPSKPIIGPDLIPAFLIRDCAGVFCAPLHILFNLILKTSTFPDIWKTSRVSPVFKKGNRNDVNNYRPVAIINNFSKAFEFILHDHISYYTSRLFTVSQHGFMPGRSTTTNLTCVTQFISESLDQRCQVDVIYTDFSKAFDRLNHSILTDKLKLFGFSTPLVGLFRSYLSGRRQYVQYNGFRSAAFTQPSGVPQGTVLGPDLFNIFINDIVACLDVNCLLYADDMKLYRSIHALRDCLVLQEGLDVLNEWCIRNQLSLNITKCNIMSYHRVTSPIIFDYTIGGRALSRPSVIKDLGVTFDCKLTFVNHIESVVAGALRMLGFELRGCRFLSNIMTFRTLYVSFVRSRLEYASVVWAPVYDVHMTSLEKVQRRFLKTSSFMLTGSYPERGTPQQHLLQQFNMQSLLCRRNMHSVLFLYKLVNGDIDCPELLSHLGLRVPGHCSRSPRLFHLPFARTNALSSSPVHRMIRNYTCIEEACDILHCNSHSIRAIFSSFDSEN